MSALSAQAMSELLTMPYRRGAELMDIPVGTDAGGFTNIPAYDFTEYRARYRISRVPLAGVVAEPVIQVDPLQPKYVLYPRKNIGADEMELEVGFSSGGPPSSTVVKIPARTLAGVSFVIPLPANADASVRLLRFRQLPLPLSGTGAENWGIVVLLGNISKLLWVLGREKDEIRQQLFDVARQRFRAFAHGSSLDRLGADLRIARFPPREHSFDASTLALYHLNETIPAIGPVTDDTVRFGLVGHAGVNAGAQSGVNGKFGTAFSFPGQAATGRIAIDHHADFNIAANRSFTAEVFIKAETIDNPLPRIVLMKRAQEPAGPLIAGWSISLGSFRGITNNVMWAVSDGANEVKIFADVNVADGKIHHLAGVIDRTARRARLYVDGEQRVTAGIAALGAIANAEPIRIGGSAAANQFVGMIDEVRLSSIARGDFHPVLGEGDEAYRQRLGIFERWLLPTPGNLLSTINELVQINGETDSFILIENDRPSVVASKVVRILTPALLAGQHIDRDGNLLSRESEVSGVAAEDSDFNELYLLRHDRPEVNYLGVENNRRMQASLKADLDALLSQLIDAGVPGRVNITKGFDAADRGLHSVGRALRFTHETLPLDRLGALAHRAGFDFVRNSGTEIYASAAAGEKLELIIEPRPVADTPPAGIDVFVTKAVNLHFAPETLPVNGSIDWTLIQCDAGRAHFERHPADAATLRTPVAARRHLRLVADAPGEVTVHVEYTLARHTVSCTRTLLFSVETLANSQRIAANGDMQITDAAAAVGSPETVFNPIYFITSNAPVNFGAAPNNRRMQLVLERPFMRLLALLQSIGAATNQLQVLQAFDPAGPGLHRVGRAMRFSHGVLDPGRLGALAHRAGFGFVQRNGAEIFAAVAADEKIEIVRTSDLTPLADEVVAGTTIEVQARFSALPSAGNFNWSFQQLGHGRGSLDFVLRPKVRFTPRSPGLLALNVTFLEPDPQATFPYTFEIRLKNSLNVPGTVIPKHQYDLLMNLLSYFHPIGVEVVTRNIREHVVEVQGNLLNAFPGYTYPDFRA